MPVAYVDFRTAPVDGKDHIAEFTWASEAYNSLDVHHYFVDYPGAKDLERQLVEILGGSTFVRYSCMIVLKAFIDSLEEGYIIATRTKKQKSLLVKELKKHGLETPRAICTFDDVASSEEEASAVMRAIEDARFDASRKFGNSL